MRHVLFVFFKQKTAYYMRISDWSSDVCSSDLSAGFAAALVFQSARGTVVPWVVQTDRLGQTQAVAPAEADYQPTDPQIAFHLARFVEQVRSIPSDALIVRQNRSEERRVGKASVGTCRFRWSPSH